jgi:acetoin utilization deacetylase AcuC-like enzyme
LILYSAGVDAHIEDPLGGMLTTEQLGKRDEMMFAIAKRLGIPVAFNLAGGYQRDADGGISKVVQLHLDTFSAALRVHGQST